MQDDHGLFPLPRRTDLVTVTALLALAAAGAHIHHAHFVNLLDRLTNFRLIRFGMHLEGVGPAAAGPRVRGVVVRAALVGTLLSHERAANNVIEVHGYSPAPAVWLALSMAKASRVKMTRRGRSTS